MAPFSSTAELHAYQQALVERRDPDRTVIAVCYGTGCKASGATELIDALKKAVQEAGCSDRVSVMPTGCHGFCEGAPLVVVHPRRILYTKVKPRHAADIVNKTALAGEVIEPLLFVDPDTGNKVVHEGELPFYAHQHRLLLGRHSTTNPEEIDDYLANGGYGAWARILDEQIAPEAIIELIKKSGLRGRGGGGFPAGRKWDSCRNAPGEVHYVICNADEGDPGAFMDESVLEGNPHSVIEGMIIGAYAIGFPHSRTEGYVYIRHEYPLARHRLAIALDQAREKGLLGDNILGSGLSFDITVNRGGGAFVCGESTALMASIEGFPGEPRAKHIHTVVSGLYGMPTNLNNVETWANVPVILNMGVQAYRAIGTEHSKGTKIFSLVGKVNNTGLVEVPMGMTLKDIIFQVGGGIRNGKRFKAVQTGGPSGGCIPASLIDLPVDFDRLDEVGSMMGSGGMIVMDETTCMVEVARYFLNFLRSESCGKCSTCREGIARMYDIVEGITRGEGKPGDVELLEELAEVVREASLCALGTTAPNPVLSTIRYFAEEYRAHIEEKRCPAKQCKALITYRIIEDRCTGCTACAKICPTDAITGVKDQVHLIHQEKCIQCGSCYEVCPVDAISVE
ncbi:MAG: 4Fe-4S binding protein [Bradymonadales bacterium]|nr:4Fe-4S binding protein [Bradymonadales bacterium]